MNGAFQQARRVLELGTTEEPYVDVRRERIDVGERGVPYARGRMAIM